MIERLIYKVRYRNADGQTFYKAYLRSDHWHNTRIAALERAEYKCAKCGSMDQLQVHHLRYHRKIKGKWVSILWQEKPWDLQVLCDQCHDAVSR